MNLSSLVASDYIELLILCKKKKSFFFSVCSWTVAQTLGWCSQGRYIS